MKTETYSVKAKSLLALSSAAFVVLGFSGANLPVRYCVFAAILFASAVLGLPLTAGGFRSCLRRRYCVVGGLLSIALGVRFYLAWQRSPALAETANRYALSRNALLILSALIAVVLSVPFCSAVIGWLSETSAQEKLASLHIYMRGLRLSAPHCAALLPTA